MRKTTIRIMGDKEISQEIASKIIRILEEHGYDFTAPREFPMYKNKKQRTKDNIDPTKTRLYLTVYAEE